MKSKLKKLIVIMVAMCLICISYLIGLYSENRVSYSNSENEISAEEIPFENSESESDFVEVFSHEFYKSHIAIIEEECRIHVDGSQLVDYYVDGNWYCYYVYNDGDAYIITLKNNHVDMDVIVN